MFLERNQSRIRKRVLTLMKNVETATQGKLRAMNLESFAKFADGSDTFSNMVDIAFDRKKIPLLNRRIACNANFSNDVERHFQIAYVEELVDKTIDELKFSAEQKKQEEVRAQVEVDRAKEKLDSARKAFEKAKAKLESAKKATAYAEEAVAKTEAVYHHEMERLENMDKIILLHPSAVLSQLERYGDYRIIVSYVDEPVFKRLGLVDEIFDKEKASEIGVEVDNLGIPEEEISSKIAYAQMVAWYWLKDIPCELVYADQTIAKILRHNGLID